MLLHLGCDCECCQCGMYPTRLHSGWGIRKKVAIKLLNTSATAGAEKTLFLAIFLMCIFGCMFVFSREGVFSNSSLLADPRVNLLTNGGLEIANVTHDDEGLYTCSVQNTNLSVSAVLEVLSE